MTYDPARKTVEVLIALCLLVGVIAVVVAAAGWLVGLIANGPGEVATVWVSVCVVVAFAAVVLWWLFVRLIGQVRPHDD